MVNEQNDMIAEANAAAERLERANKEHAELLKKAEAMEARRILGGQTSAGSQQAPQLSEDQKIIEENKQLFKGGVLEGVFK